MPLVVLTPLKNEGAKACCFIPFQQLELFQCQNYTIKEKMAVSMLLPSRTKSVITDMIRICTSRAKLPQHVAGGTVGAGGSTVERRTPWRQKHCAVAVAGDERALSCCSWPQCCVQGVTPRPPNCCVRLKCYCVGTWLLMASERSFGGNFDGWILAI